MSHDKMPRLLMPVLGLLVLMGAAQSDPTVKASSAPAPTPPIPRRSPPYLLPDGSITFDPSLLAPSQQAREELSQLRAAPVFPHGPGDIIPPCVIAYGWTVQGPTDQNGHVLRVAPHLPLGVYVQQSVPRPTPGIETAGCEKQMPTCAGTRIRYLPAQAGICPLKHGASAP